MGVSKAQQPTLVKVAPRFLVADREQALAFYGQLGFATTSHDEGFAMLELLCPMIWAWRVGSACLVVAPHPRLRADQHHQDARGGAFTHCSLSALACC